MAKVFSGEGWQATLDVASGAAPLLLVACDEKMAEAVRAAAVALPVHHLLVLARADWAHAYAPWLIRSPFVRDEVLDGGAETLALLRGTILPQALADLPAPPTWCGILGYSLAGLFALYAVLVTDDFQRGASVSGALWAPGVAAFVAAASVPPLSHFYFSLGSREHKTRVPMLRAIRGATKQTADQLSARGVQTVFEQNPGNHFDDVPQRLVRAMQWLLEA